MQKDMTTKEGQNIGVVLISAFIVSVAILSTTYFFLGFQISVITGMCFIITMISIAGTGVENTLTNEVRNQIVEFRADVGGYLSDLYAEIQKKK